MKTQALPGILVLFFAAACPRKKSGGASSPQAAQPAANVAAQGTDGGGDGTTESQVAREKGKKFKKRMDAAKEAFGKRDLPAALAELEVAEGIDGDHVELLTLRGACHVETRDFASALADFPTTSWAGSGWVSATAMPKSTSKRSPTSGFKPASRMRPAR